MRILNIAIAGLGGVGRAAASLLLSRRERYQALYGTDVRLVAVCGSRAGLADPGGLEEHSFDALQSGLSGPDFIMESGADILIEAGPSNFHTGGPGLAYIARALEGGLDTIVISKGALVHSGPTLRASAQRSGALLKISGAAAAALPTVDLVEHSLLGCRVLSIEGILNATTNYLLDAMTTRGLTFDEALAQAQAGGFAEADPRNDTEGWDTAAKLLLLANFGLGANLSIEDMVVQGIQSVTTADIDAWRAAGLVPKLVGYLNRNADDSIVAGVELRAYPPDDPLALARGKNKAIRITTDAMGETIAIGSGIEPLATAAAALKDLEHIMRLRCPTDFAPKE